jgi:hypothetical protein
MLRAVGFLLQCSAADFEFFSAVCFSAADMLALQHIAAAVLKNTSAAVFRNTSAAVLRNTSAAVLKNTRAAVIHPWAAAVQRCVPGALQDSLEQA